MSGRDDMRDHDSARLAELVLGVLDPEERAALEAEVAASPELAAELAALRQALAGLDGLSAPVTPSDALRERVLAIPDPATRFEGFVARMARMFDFTSERAREVLAAIGDLDAGWVSPGSGVHLYHFGGGPAVAEADCGLVYVAEGVAFPVHEHRGDEWSFNLQGLAIEDGGHLLEPGDVVHRASGSRHGFRSVGDEPYVFAVVLYGGFHPVDGGGGSS